jgi:hypothetical protein
MIVNDFEEGCQRFSFANNTFDAAEDRAEILVLTDNKSENKVVLPKDFFERIKVKILY